MLDHRSDVGGGRGALTHPGYFAVLMDFGSTRQLAVEVHSRAEALRQQEDAEVSGNDTVLSLCVVCWKVEPCGLEFAPVIGWVGHGPCVREFDSSQNACMEGRMWLPAHSRSLPVWDVRLDAWCEICPWFTSSVRFAFDLYICVSLLEPDAAHPCGIRISARASPPGRQASPILVSLTKHFVMPAPLV